MAANAEWEQEFVLTSPYGTLTLNTAVGDRYLLVPQSCDMGAPLRVTKDNIPQADGSILHHRFTEGYECRLTLELWQDGAIACGADMVRMLDTINEHAFGLLNAGDNQGRLSWPIAGGGVNSNRMLDDIRLLERVVAQVGDGGLTVVTFAVDTVYPYAMNLTQILTPIPEGVPTVLTNTGNTSFWPVIQVNQLNGTPSGSACTGFTLQNQTPTPDLLFEWTDVLSTPIPGGSYGEIDCFRNTFYLNGNQTNLKPGVDFLTSDFWPLTPGANTIYIAGCDCDVLWNAPWS